MLVYVIIVIILLMIVPVYITDYILKFIGKSDESEGCCGCLLLVALGVAVIIALASYELIGDFCDKKLNINFLHYREETQEAKEREIKEKIAAEEEARVTERVSNKNIRYKILNYRYAGNNLIINLRVENISSDPFSIHKVSGVLKDKKDNSYQGKISLLSLFSNLNPGMSTDILLIFSVPVVQKYDLWLNDSIWSDPLVLHLQ